MQDSTLHHSPDCVIAGVECVLVVLFAHCLQVHVIIQITILIDQFGFVQIEIIVWGVQWQ